MNKFLKENWLLILSLIYILSPIDFIPEVLLGPIGIVDDLTLVVFLLVVKTVQVISEKYKERKSKFKEVIEME